MWKETFSANAFCSRLHLSGNKNTRRRTSTLIFYSASRFNWSRLWFNLMGQITVCDWWGFIVPSHSNQTIPDHQTTEGSGCFKVFSFPMAYHKIKRRKLLISTNHIADHETTEGTSRPEKNLFGKSEEVSSVRLSIPDGKEILSLKASSFPHMNIMARKTHFKCRPLRTPKEGLAHKYLWS